ncbi:MAG TPA: organic hydroperoxide resistance protein [Micavibrio sp.]|jgi:Ohr subfamily peroxiredoxin
MKTLYTAHAHATNGREGHAETDDKKVSVNLSRPSSNGPGTNPEQLFACGYAACFGGAAQHVAKQKGLEVGEVTVHADVNLNQDDNGFFLSVVLNVDLPMLDQAEASALVEATHQFCPYSKATRGNIEVTLKANGKPVAKAA